MNLKTAYVMYTETVNFVFNLVCLYRCDLLHLQNLINFKLYQDEERKHKIEKIYIRLDQDYLLLPKRSFKCMIRWKETIACRRFDIQLRILEVINKAHAWKRLSEHQVAEKQHCNVKKKENEETASDQYKSNVIMWIFFSCTRKLMEGT